MKVRARHLVLGACLSTLVMAAAATGWACTVMASVTAPVPGQGPAGTSVVVEGSKFLKSVPVAVVFRSQSNDETVVWDGTTTAHGGFTARFNVPGGTAPGRYTVIGRVEGFEAAAENSFNVTPTQADPLPPREKEEAGTETELPPPLPDPVNHSQPGDAGNEGIAQTTPQQTGAGDQSSGSGGGPAGRPGGGRSGLSTPDQRSTDGSTPAGAAAISTDAAAATSAPAPEASPAPLPSARSATDELWSGFSEGPRRAVNGRSLTDPVPDADGGGMTAGLVLLTLGLMTLGAAFGVATVRRRRAPATTR